jgi:hypothetical protein
MGEGTEHEEMMREVTFPVGKPRLLTPEEAAESDRLAEAEEAAEIARKGHDCWEYGCSHPRTPTCPPYVDCELCGNTIQVG